MNCIFFLLITCFASLHGNVFEHLKKVEGKSDIHKMRNIDFIYMINLDQRPEKFESTVNQLHPYGIYPYRFSAVNGWELTLEDVNDVGVKFSSDMARNIMGTAYLPDGDFDPHHEIIQKFGRTYFCHCMSRGAIGCILSHLSILKDAYDSRYETIWIIEDDIHVLQDPRTISDLVEELNALVTHDGWDILYTDQDSKNADGDYVRCQGIAKRPNYVPLRNQKFDINMKFNENFRRISLRYGTYSMIIRRSGMKKILKFYKKHQIFLPYDMDYYFAKNLRIYTVLNDVISTSIDAISDNGGANYLDK